MQVANLFSQKTREIIGEARQIAIDLGYSYISTLHILLADCTLNHKDSIRNFAFSSEKEFQHFFESHKIDESTILATDLPLTIEAALTLRKSVLLFHNHFWDAQIQPYHLFLAASQLKKTAFFP